mmetsp:Transcript_19770/g.14507  ORF Transcript_19770/g.14507 Transcript_19770/m.14507 type:complete len:99 (-) Transcript_19770:1275-1571(-)
MEDNEKLEAFLESSEDFYNVFTTCNLEDFRKVKEEKQDNFVYLVSFCIKVISEAALQCPVLNEDRKKKQVQGAIHILTRVFPLLFEDKELLLRTMWRE